MYYYPFYYQDPRMFCMPPNDGFVYLQQMNRQHSPSTMEAVGKDYGGRPYVVNIEEATERNKSFRTAIWTGTHLQVTLMSIGIGEDIGLEIHPNTDQFLRIEEGESFVFMGDDPKQLVYRQHASDDDAIMIPAGTWHNIVNIGNQPLKLYSIYAPPEHPFGTIHQTKKIATNAEHKH